MAGHALLRSLMALVLAVHVSAFFLRPSVPFKPFLPFVTRPFLGPAGLKGNLFPTRHLLLNDIPRRKPPSRPFTLADVQPSPVIQGQLNTMDAMQGVDTSMTQMDTMSSGGPALGGSYDIMATGGAEGVGMLDVGSTGGAGGVDMTSMNVAMDGASLGTADVGGGGAGVADSGYGLDTTANLGGPSGGTLVVVKGFDNGFDNGKGGYDNGNGGFDNGRGGFDNGRGGYDNGRGGYDNGRGGYDNGNGNGGYDNGRGGYDNGRGGYDNGNSYGGYDNGNGNGGYDNGRGGYDNGRGGYDNGHGNGGYDNGRGGYDNGKGYERDNGNRRSGRKTSGGCTRCGTSGRLNVKAEDSTITINGAGQLAAAAKVIGEDSKIVINDSGVAGTVAAGSGVAADTVATDKNGSYGY